MAKCSNCDYPYVPKYKPCPNCGDSGSDSESNSTGCNLIAFLLSLCFGIFCLYQEFTFGEDDMDHKWFSLNNRTITFDVWEYAKETDKRTYIRFNNNSDITDRGTWKLENDSVILYPDNAGNGIFEKYSVDDLKEDPH
jgi:hypothetical protein